MDKKTPDTVARTVTRSAMSYAGASIALLLCSAPCCLWAALRSLERGLSELWCFAPTAGFALLAVAVWVQGRARWVFVVPGLGILAAAYFFLQ